MLAVVMLATIASPLAVAIFDDNEQQDLAPVQIQPMSANGLIIVDRNIKHALRNEFVMTASTFSSELISEVNPLSIGVFRCPSGICTWPSRWLPMSRACYQDCTKCFNTRERAHTWVTVTARTFCNICGFVR